MFTAVTKFWIPEVSLFPFVVLTTTESSSDDSFLESPSRLLMQLISEKTSEFKCIFLDHGISVQPTQFILFNLIRGFVYDFIANLFNDFYS